MLLSGLDSSPLFRTRDCLSYVSKRCVRTRSFFSRGRFLSGSGEWAISGQQGAIWASFEYGDYAILGNSFGTIKVTVSIR